MKLHGGPLLAAPREAGRFSAMEHFGRLVFLAGLGLALLGALLWLGGQRGCLSWIGRLPGDIRIEGERGGFYFPLATCLLASVVLSGLLALFRRFFGG